MGAIIRTVKAQGCCRNGRALPFVKACFLTKAAFTAQFIFKGIVGKLGYTNPLAANVSVHLSMNVSVFFRNLSVLVFAGAVLSACGSIPSSTSSVPGQYKVGNPYMINGKRYVPRVEPDYNQVGVASWYGRKFHGRKTANGEIYNMNAMTAAHPTLPLPSLVRVTNLSNGRSEILRVNDRGPFARGRIIDVSRAASQKLGFQGQGTTKVRVEYLALASLNPSAPNVLPSQAPSTMIAQAPRAPAAPAAQPIEERPQAKVIAAAQAAHPIVPDRKNYYISSSVTDPLEAELLRQEFGATYSGTMIIPLQTEARTDYYKVRIGPITSEREALDHLQAVRDGGHHDAIITFDQSESF